jgi:hypothetical protein
VTTTDFLATWNWLSEHGLEVLAIALSPLFALQVSAKIERRRDDHNRKLYALQTLLATRHAPFADDRIRTLNMIDVLFPNDGPVRQARTELMRALSKTEGLNPDGSVDKKLSDEWNERQWDLVSAMAAVLTVPMTKEDFASGYAPKALNDALGEKLLSAETNKSLIMFARKELGLRWNPDALYKYPNGAGIMGEYHEAATSAEKGSSAIRDPTDDRHAGDR